MQMKKWENEYRTTMICIDDYENQVPTGRFYNLHCEDGVRFHGVMDLIKKLMTNQISGENDPTPWQEIRFTCSGGVDHYKTSFAIFGFRYVQVVTKTEINLISKYLSSSF